MKKRTPASSKLAQKIFFVSNPLSGLIFHSLLNGWKVLPFAFILLFISSCRDKEREKRITSITLTPSSPAVAVGLTQQLTATIEPADATRKELSWSSSDETKATVDATGKVTGAGNGTAIITATATDGSNVKGMVTINITPKVTSVAIVPANPSVGIGGKRTLIAVALPAEATQAVTWTSSDPTKATIDAATGAVTGIALGSAVITATATDGSGITATATLTVNNAVITLGDEYFVVAVPAAGGNATIANAPRTVASDIKKVKVNIAAANASIKIGTADFASGNTVDFSSPVTFTVTADGTAKSYTVGITAYDAVANPYGIYTVRHLVDVANGLSESYLLKNNIDLPNADAAGVAATGIKDYAEAGWLPLNTFNGIFDGGNLSINNFYLNRKTFAGLFKILGKGSTVKNLGVNGVTSGTAVTTHGNTTYTGVLAGRNHGTIDKCYATGSVYSSSTTDFTFPAGGLVGENHGTISNSYASGNVSTSSSRPVFPSLFGGLVGSNRGTITNSYATGNVSAYYAGGLVGWNQGTVSNSYATGNASSSSVVGSAGGLAGRSDGTISNSYATGNASAFRSAGGLVGHNANRSTLQVGGTISNSYATGNVSASSTDSSTGSYAGSYAGGLVGDNDGGSISNSYYAKGSVSSSYSVAAKTYAGGLVGHDRDPDKSKYTNCYRDSDIAITKNNQAISASPYDLSIVGIVAKTKAEMQTDAFKDILKGITLSIWGREDAKNDKLPYIIGVGVGK